MAFVPPVQPVLKPLTQEEARQASLEVVAVLTEASNTSKLNQAKEAAQGDVFKMMVTVMPLAISIVGPTIAKYGFTPDQPGVMQFISSINVHGADPVIAQQRAQLMSQFLPPGFVLPNFSAQPQRP